MPLDPAKPPIPTELRQGLSPVEFHLFYIAKKNASELARQANRAPCGVSWGGLGDFSEPYVGKAYEEMLAEAEALVAARASQVAA